MMPEDNTTVKGKVFEQLTTIFERYLKPEGFLIEWQARIPGRISGEVRKVDFTIRYDENGKSLLVMGECRDRGTHQNIMWIDELIGKAKDINADKIIAVSSNGFTPTAKKYAKKAGVELRTLSEVNIDEIMAWVKIKSIRIRTHQVLFDKIYFDVSDIGDVEYEIESSVKSALLDGDRFEDKIFRRKKNQIPASLMDVWRSGHLDRLFNSLSPGKMKKQKIILNFDKHPEEYIQIQTTNGWMDVEQIYLEVELRIIDTKAPIKGETYRDDENEFVICEAAIGELTHEGKKHRLMIMESHNGNKQIQIVREEKFNKKK